MAAWFPREVGEFQHALKIRDVAVQVADGENFDRVGQMHDSPAPPHHRLAVVGGFPDRIKQFRGIGHGFQAACDLALS
jgi:hypothetical protein